MFLIHKMDTTLTRGIEYVPADVGKPGVLIRPNGDAGYITADEDVKPSHLALGGVNESGLIPAMRIDVQIEFETVTETDLTDVTVSSLLKTDGETVRAETGGPAMLVYKEKLADGTWLARVRFD